MVDDTNDNSLATFWAVAYFCPEFGDCTIHLYFVLVNP